MDDETIAQALTVNIGMTLGKITPIIFSNPPRTKVEAMALNEKLLREADNLEAAGFPGATLFVQSFVDGIESWIGGATGFLDS